MKLALTSAVAVLAANVAFAGGFVAPVVEATPVAVVEEVAPAIDWTGFYVGAQYGQGNADVSGGGVSVDLGDFDAYGLHGGYLHDMGSYVLGGELDYNRIDTDAGDGDLWRLKGRAGADLGKFLPYVTLGVAHVSADEISETGFMYGLGADYMITNRFSVGAEYTRQDFKDILDTDGVDMDADMVQLRAAFRF